MGFSKSCYLFEIDHDRSWTTAQSSCEARGAHLVAINTENEYEFLKARIEYVVTQQSGHFGREIWWTGGRRSETAGAWNWYWDDGDGR